MWKKLLFRLTVAVLLLGLVGSLLYAGVYFYTTWRTDQLYAQLSRQRSIAVKAPSPEPTPALPQSAASGVRIEATVPDGTANVATKDAPAATNVSTDVSIVTVADDFDVTIAPADDAVFAATEDSAATIVPVDASIVPFTDDSAAKIAPIDGSIVTASDDPAVTIAPTGDSIVTASDDPAVTIAPTGDSIVTTPEDSAVTTAPIVSSIVTATDDPAPTPASTDIPDASAADVPAATIFPIYTPNTTAADDPAATIVPTHTSNDTATDVPSPTPASTDTPDASATAVPADDPLLTYYNSLAEKNPDMIGWLSIADTIVDYPVMCTPEDPQYYLNHNFDRKYSMDGMPFLDARCDADAPSDNLIVYGHNMRSGRMFGTLSRYRDAEYRLAHPLISFDTLKERRVYRLYAGFVVRTTENLDDADMICYRMNLTSDEAQLQTLLDYVSQHALFVDPEVEPMLQDQLLTLSTCTSVRKSERFVLIAVRVE